MSRFDVARKSLLEHFDLHGFTVEQTPQGLVMTADRYGYRVVRVVSETLLEDSIMPRARLLSCVIDDMAMWLRMQPIVNHDTGDEDRS